MELESQSLLRYKTAIRRYKLSRPMSLAHGHGLLEKDASLLDYGCGHGEDVQVLKGLGIAARGWDPNSRPDPKPSSAKASIVY